MADQADAHASAIDRELKQHVTSSGKLDLESLRKRNAPLAQVIDEFAMSKTVRDLPETVAHDVSVALQAHDNPGLGRALKELKGKLG